MKLKNDMEISSVLRDYWSIATEPIANVVAYHIAISAPYCYMVASSTYRKFATADMLVSEIVI